uniref:Uncharacterized protein n=1 Tax=Arundo donax TaxID=35708 RepID=A0A0A8ZHZ3_ARUDO
MYLFVSLYYLLGPCAHISLRLCFPIF